MRPVPYQARTWGFIPINRRQLNASIQAPPASRAQPSHRSSRPRCGSWSPPTRMSVRVKPSPSGRPERPIELQPPSVGRGPIAAGAWVRSRGRKGMGRPCASLTRPALALTADHGPSLWVTPLQRARPPDMRLATGNRTPDDQGDNRHGKAVNESPTPSARFRSAQAKDKICLFVYSGPLESHGVVCIVGGEEPAHLRHEHDRRACFRVLAMVEGMATQRRERGLPDHAARVEMASREKRRLRRDAGRRRREDPIEAHAITRKRVDSRCANGRVRRRRGHPSSDRRRRSAGCWGYPLGTTRPACSRRRSR